MFRLNCPNRLTPSTTSIRAAKIKRKDAWQDAETHPRTKEETMIDNALTFLLVFILVIGAFYFLVDE